MKMNWQEFIGKIVTVTMNENYGVMYGNRGPQEQPNFYEIVFKTGKLKAAFDDGLLLEAEKDGTNMLIFVFFNAMKCVEII